VLALLLRLQRPLQRRGELHPALPEAVRGTVANYLERIRHLAVTSAGLPEAVRVSYDAQARGGADGHPVMTGGGGAKGDAGGNGGVRDEVPAGGHQAAAGH